MGVCIAQGNCSLLGSCCLNRDSEFYCMHVCYSIPTCVDVLVCLCLYAGRSVNFLDNLPTKNYHRILQPNNDNTATSFPYNLLYVWIKYWKLYSTALIASLSFNFHLAFFFHSYPVSSIHSFRLRCIFHTRTQSHEIRLISSTIKYLCLRFWTRWACYRS